MEPTPREVSSKAPTGTYTPRRSYMDMAQLHVTPCNMATGGHRRVGQSGQTGENARQTTSGARNSCQMRPSPKILPNSGLGILVSAELNTT
jgi:hypothetical protein